MNSYVKSGNAQRGFTLIELVVVIVILGILAAFAVPKFMGLEVQARVASVNSLAGTLRSASAMAHGLALATGQNAATGSITVNGKAEAVAWGYPTTVSISDLLDPSVITVKAETNKFTNTNGVFTLNGATNMANCSVTYVAAKSANVAPVVTAKVLTANGC